MEPIEIFGGVVGLIALLALIACMVFGIASCEKSEQKKRDLYDEVKKYYAHRNNQFEKEDK